MTSTTNSVKQRKISDLRVIDLQRELRVLNVIYDKKELKGSLLEKLRQALLNRNIDPDNHLFEAVMDLKSISSDEINRSHEENGSYEANCLDTSTLSIDSEPQLDIENPVQTNPIATSLTNEIDDEQTNRMDIMDLRQVVEDHVDDDNIFLTIDDHSTTKQEDENNNDKIDYGPGQVTRSLSDEELDSKNSTQQFTDNHFFKDEKESVATPPSPSTARQQTSSDPDHGEEERHTTSNLPSIDNDTKSKSELDRQDSSNEQQKQQSANQSNTNPCRIWVSNIAKRTHASDLKTLFSKYGKVLTTKVIGSDSSQWFGYINLASPDDVAKCINALHQTELHGKKIYVDREMHEEPTRSSSKSKSNNHSTSSTHHTSSRESSSNTNKKRPDQSNYKSSSNDSQKKRDTITNSHDKSSTSNTDPSSKKRPTSSSTENKKKLSTSDANKSTNDEKTVKSHETNSPTKTSSNSNNVKTSTPSTGSNSQSSKHHVSRADAPKISEIAESSHKTIANDRKNDPHWTKSEKSSSSYSKDASQSKTSSSNSHRSHSNEKRSTSSSTKSDRHRSSSIDKSKQHPSSHSTSNKYDKSKEIHRTKLPNTLESDRRSVYQNEQRLRHEKEILVHKQFVQQQEEEKIKEQQRRLAEERERMRREFENLERERFEIERTRSALEKEKQDQARELDRQQRRLAEEAKYRQQQADAKLCDEKLHRIAHSDNKRPRSSHHDSPRSYQSNTNNTTTNSSSGSSSNKSYDNRSSASKPSARGCDRSLGDTNRDYYPEPKRQYTSNVNNPREAVFRDRVGYRDSDLPTSTAGLSLSSSSSMTSNNTNQRYLPPSSSQHRLSDPYNTLPPRGRDMALPPTSSIGTPYERRSRDTVSSPTNNSSALARRPHSRERYDEREYMQQTQRRDRSPPANSALRREIIETTHWERPKPRDSTHYPADTHKYLPNSYLSESSQSNQQQGLWSAAPPSRQQQQQQQQHHHDLSLKAISHGSVVDPYGWPHVSQQVPPQPPPSHHPQGLSSSHDRSRANVTNNQRISILASNQPPPPPPSSRGGATGQTHLYNHPGIPVSALSTPQQHTSLAPPPPSLRHPTAYVTQQAPPPGLVLHPTGQTRAYEPHYVVTQSLPQRRY